MSAQVGEIQRDSEGVWVVVATVGAFAQPSRVRLGSLAHQAHAVVDPRIAASLPNAARQGEDVST